MTHLTQARILPIRPLSPTSLLNSRAARWIVRLTTALRSPLIQSCTKPETQAVNIPFPAPNQAAARSLPDTSRLSAAPPNLTLPRYWEGGNHV